MSRSSRRPKSSAGRKSKFPEGIEAGRIASTVPATYIEWVTAVAERHGISVSDLQRLWLVEKMTGVDAGIDTSGIPRPRIVPTRKELKAAQKKDAA